MSGGSLQLCAKIHEHCEGSLCTKRSNNNKGGLSGFLKVRGVRFLMLCETPISKGSNISFGISQAGHPVFVTRCSASLRRALRSILLVDASGSWSTNHTKRGCWYAGPFASANCLISSSDGRRPALGIMKATGFCPFISSSIGTTAAWVTSGCLSSIRSTSPGP